MDLQDRALKSEPRPVKRSRPRLPERLGRSLLALAAMYLVLEGASYVGLRVVSKVRHLQYDPNPTALAPDKMKMLRGVVEDLKKGKKFRITFDGPLGWVMGPPAVNSAGMRDSREYSLTPAPGFVRMSAFGDSFTYGSDIPLEATWEKQIGKLAPSLEVLNYGVEAYGFDQAYLRYLELGADYHPSAVLIGYLSENINRDVNVYRPFYTSMYRDWLLSKPRFILSGGNLVLVPNPLPAIDDYERLLRNDAAVLGELGRNDYFYRHNYNYGRFDFSPSVRLGKLFWRELDQSVLHPIFRPDGIYDIHSEAYTVTVKLFDAFYRKVLDNGALPIIVLFPSRTDQQRSREGKVRSYQPMIEYFRGKGYRFIDTLKALEPHRSEYTLDQLSMLNSWGHFSQVASGIAARYMLEQLRQQDLMDAGRLNQAAQAERARLPR